MCRNNSAGARPWSAALEPRPLIRQAQGKQDRGTRRTKDALAYASGSLTTTPADPASPDNGYAAAGCLGLVKNNGAAEAGTPNAR
jgi:hypothetical protein